MAAAPRSVPKPTPVEVNGWKLFAHPLFDAEFELLVKEVERLRATDPVGYVEKKTTKLLAAIFKMAFEIIPRDPTDPMFRQGKTLGAANRHWHRGKFFQNRYRLFFRYSTSHKVIILAWINDEETLRTYGSKTDAYAVFEKMLAKNRPPSDWTTLFDEAKAAQLNSPLARAFANLGKQKKTKET
jgi:toxin YhaV